MRDARAATEPDDAAVARLAEASGGLSVVARVATTPDDAEVRRVVARARLAPARTSWRLGWLLGLGLAGAAFAGAAWWPEAPVLVVPEEIAPVEVVRAVEPVVIPPAPAQPLPIARPPRAPPVKEPAVPEKPLPELAPPPIPEAPAAAPNAEARALAALLARVEAGEPPRQVLAAVEAWTSTASAGPLREEGELLTFALAARVRAPGPLAKKAAAWAAGHPAHPRAGETWLLAGDLAERANACVDATANWERAAATSPSLRRAADERLTATRCR